MTHLLMTQQDIDSNPSRWKDFRRQGVTASEIAAILGFAPATQNSAWKVFAAKTTGEDFDIDTDATLRGTHLEPYVASRFKKDHPEYRVIPGGLFHAQGRPWQMATFDRFAYSAELNAPWMTFPVQLKTAINRFDANGDLVWGEPGTDEIPLHYRAQCLWELDVAAADKILIPCLFMDSWKLAVYRITRNADVNADLAFMREAAQEFLNRMERDDPPPVDWTPATTSALKTMYQDAPEGEVAVPVKLARQYRDARRAKVAAERRFNQAVNEMLALAGNAKYITLGQRGRYRLDTSRVASRSVAPRRSYDTEQLRKKYPDIAEELERKTTVVTVRAGKWAKSPTERNTDD